MANVDVLLATYNGAAWLPSLLDSLERQTSSDWRLLHRDDGSRDGSADLVAEWAHRTGRPFVAIEDGRGNLGAMQNFAALLEVSDAPHFMPCDQDDIWEPEKIAFLEKLIAAREARVGMAMPVIVHTDLAVVDDALREIHPSLWRYQRLIMPREQRPWTLLAVQNCVTGCAMIGNAALRRMALPLPDSAMMHDWWLALIAACFGEIISEARPTVRYRQHSSNARGAKAWGHSAGVWRALSAPLSGARHARWIVAGTQAQAFALVARYREQLSPEQCDFFARYAQLSRKSFIRRKLFPFQHSLWHNDLVRNIGLLSAL